MSINASNLTINVKDLDKSIAFYQSIGLTLTNRWGNHYANLTGSSGNVSIGFTTDDFEGAKVLLNGLSIPVTERQEAGGKFLHFNDPDGTAHYFIQPKW